MNFKTKDKKKKKAKTKRSKTINKTNEHLVSMLILEFLPAVVMRPELV